MLSPPKRSVPCICLTLPCSLLASHPHNSPLKRWMCASTTESQAAVPPGPRLPPGAAAAETGNRRLLAAGPPGRAKLAHGKAGLDPLCSARISARSACLVCARADGRPFAECASLWRFSQVPRRSIELSQQSSESARKRRKVSEPLKRIFLGEETG